MTYNEWRDELKSNLLSVSESERRRVLDYYAEAYADRRDAGYTEREIIEDFGAPYDAAQRILSDNGGFDDVNYYEPIRTDRRREERERREERAREERIRREERAREERERREQRAADERYRREERAREERERREERAREERERRERRIYDDRYTAAPPPPPVQTRGDYTWIFVLLCIIFAVPIFIVVMAMVGITISFCVAPFGVMISGIVTIGAGVGTLFSDAAAGAIGIGTGLILFGVSLIIMPLCTQLVKWMWKLFHMFFAWLKRLFSGRQPA